LRRVDVRLERGDLLHLRQTAADRLDESEGDDEQRPDDDGGAEGHPPARRGVVDELRGAASAGARLLRRTTVAPTSGRPGSTAAAAARAASAHLSTSIRADGEGARPLQVCRAPSPSAGIAIRSGVSAGEPWERRPSGVPRGVPQLL